MQCNYFESINRENATENAFLKASSKNYNIIIFIHG